MYLILSQRFVYFHSLMGTDFFIIIRHIILHPAVFSKKLLFRLIFVIILRN